MSSDGNEDTLRDALAAARLEGRRKAEAFNRRLTDQEEVARSERLVDLQKRDGAAAEPDRLGLVTLSRLESELKPLREFRHAVVNSRSWRLLQFLRRLVGRAW